MITITISQHEYDRLKKEAEHWKRTAVKLNDELNEIRLKLFLAKKV